MIVELLTLGFMGWVVLQIHTPTQDVGERVAEDELEPFNINNPIVKYDLEQRPEDPGPNTELGAPGYKLAKIRKQVAQNEADLTPLQQLFQRNQVKILPGVILPNSYVPLIPMFHPKTPSLTGPSGEKMYNTAGWLN